MRLRDHETVRILPPMSQEPKAQPTSDAQDESSQQPAEAASSDGEQRSEDAKPVDGDVADVAPAAEGSDAAADKDAAADVGDDDGDEDDDDDAAEEAAPKPAKSKRKERKVLKKPPPVLVESDVDSPRPQTLVMMAAVVVPTVAIWLFATLLCNIQGVDPTRPKEPSLDELTRTAKDTAIEFHQRLATLDHDAAAKISSGAVAGEVEASRKRCQAEGDECARRRNSLLAHVRTTGVLERGDEKAADVIVTLHEAPAAQLPKRTLAVKLEKTDRWRVVASTAR